MSKENKQELKREGWYWITHPAEGDVWWPAYVRSDGVVLIDGRECDVSDLIGLVIESAILPNTRADSKPEVCAWVKQDDCNEWETSCGHGYWFEDDDTLIEKWTYCPFCGKKIEVQ